jgi:RNA polymerase sigma factor (sigma-70 family)
VATYPAPLQGDARTRVITGIASAESEDQASLQREKERSPGHSSAWGTRCGEGRRSKGRPGRILEEIGVLPPTLAALLTATDRGIRETAWAAFVETYTPLLLHTAYRFGHTYDESMDRYTYLLEQLYQNDFHRLRAFAATGPGRFTTWLVVVARRLLLDYHRQRYGRIRPLTGASGEETRATSTLRRRLVEMVGDDAALATICDSSVPDPEVAAFRAERTVALQAAVSSLEPRDKLLLTLRFDQELPTTEIAEIMGFPTQFHVYRRLRAVLARLGSLLPPEYMEAVS